MDVPESAIVKGTFTCFANVTIALYKPRSSKIESVERTMLARSQGSINDFVDTIESVL